MDIIEPLLERRQLLFRAWLDDRTPAARQEYCHAKGVARAAVQKAKMIGFSEQPWKLKRVSLVKKRCGMPSELCKFVARA